MDTLVESRARSIGLAICRPCHEAAPPAGPEPARGELVESVERERIDPAGYALWEIEKGLRELAQGKGAFINCTLEQRQQSMRDMRRLVLGTITRPIIQNPEHPTWRRVVELLANDIETQPQLYIGGEAPDADERKMIEEWIEESEQAQTEREEREAQEQERWDGQE